MSAWIGPLIMGNLIWGVTFTVLGMYVHKVFVGGLMIWIGLILIQAYYLLNGDWPKIIPDKIGSYCSKNYLWAEQEAIYNLLQLPKGKKGGDIKSPAGIKRFNNGTYGLSLSLDFTWFILGKHDRFPLYKMVGVCLGNSERDCVYLIGKDSHTNIPYILRCPPSYIKKSLLKCLAWNLGVKDNFKIKEV